MPVSCLLQVLDELTASEDTLNGEVEVALAHLTKRLNHFAAESDEQIQARAVTYRYLPLPTVTYRYLLTSRSRRVPSARDVRCILFRCSSIDSSRRHTRHTRHTRRHTRHTRRHTLQALIDRQLKPLAKLRRDEARGLIRRITVATRRQRLTLQEESLSLCSKFEGAGRVLDQHAEKCANLYEELRQGLAGALRRRLAAVPPTCGGTQVRW